MKLLLNLVQSEAEALRNSRSCGNCTACCVLPRIPPDEQALPLLPEGKAGYTPCCYLNCNGCSVYDERPPVCRDFECLWRSGHIAGDERRRPDRLGLMFGMDICRGVPVIEAWELWEGAARDYPGRGALNALLATFTLPVAIRYYGVPCSVQYQGPADLIRGAELSRLAREDPAKLADWLEQQIEKRTLENPDEQAVTLDLDRLRRGEKVVPHFTRSAT